MSPSPKEKRAFSSSTFLLLLCLFLIVPAYGQNELFFGATLSLSGSSSTQDVSHSYSNFNGVLYPQIKGSFNLPLGKQYQFGLTFQYSKYNGQGEVVNHSNFRSKGWKLRALSSGGDKHQVINVELSHNPIRVSTTIGGKAYESDTLRLELTDNTGELRIPLNFPYSVLAANANLDVTAIGHERPNVKVFVVVSEAQTGKRLAKKEISYNPQDIATIELKMDQDMILTMIVEEHLEIDGTEQIITATYNQNYGFKTDMSWERKYAGVDTRPKMEPKNMMAYLGSLPPAKPRPRGASPLAPNTLIIDLSRPSVKFNNMRFRVNLNRKM